ncbi:hypothetical protein IB267_03855 [Ensifer sp. ENS09]|uniref:hypothetical protein n=1 Tax=Ensifer sp. ENS09 TaxID=2769263 RepID=UPI001783113B|nr:hypothetical protein [Ensifer sp. ENS09]MBD9647485.1 hypothetical protein [Ensifer sp. ENS09]
MFRSLLAALAVFTAIGFTSPVAASPEAERILEAFLSCKPTFFDVLKSERAAFGPVKIEVFDDTGTTALHPDRGKLTYERVTFGRPLKVGPFTLLRYDQDRFVENAQPSLTEWGFGVAEAPEAVAQLINARLGTRYEQEEGLETWLDQSLAEPFSVSGLRIEADYRTGARQALVFCEMRTDDARRISMPVPMELFGPPQIGGPPLVDQDRLMKAFLACSDDFFEALKVEKAAFGPVKATTRKVRDNTPGSGGTVVRVDFPWIVHAWGMRLKGYERRIGQRARKGTTTWSLHVEESPRVVAFVIEGRTESVNVDGQWIVNLNEEENGGYAPAKTFAVADDKPDGSVLSCSRRDALDDAAGEMSDPHRLFNVVP